MRLDELPPDRHAALSLLLRQRKSYAELAGLLSIPQRALHDRAHAALAVLAPREARALDADAREEIGEYLLGQQDAAERAETRAYLEGSREARAWAHALAGALAPLMGGVVPELGPAPEPSDAGEAPVNGAGDRVGGPPVSVGLHATPQPRRPSSRLGGALILAAMLAVVVAAVLIFDGSGSGKSSGTATLATGTGTTPSGTGTAAPGGATGTGTGSTAKPPPVGVQVALTPPPPAHSKALGLAYLVTEGSKRAFYIVAGGLPPSTGFFYAVWLYNSASDAYPLGRLASPAANGRTEGAGALPSSAGHYRHLILTRETSTRPRQPGVVLLSGGYRLG
ncbi:MAG TPA: hypothetical protein VGX16_01155 [Solirubrobacteraceae bacterium]|jgi:hypothetical protein|nr:hypothetical protein [Solirubrobacteraceae bacterium]